jgi:hypothetical protein
MSDPATTPEHFRLGLPLRPNSPPHSSSRPANQPDVLNSQQERTTTETTGSHENRDSQSPRTPPPVRHDPPSDDADDTEPPRDSEDEYEDSPLPTPRRLRAQFKRPEIPAYWRRHVFRLVERGGHRYYDVRDDAVSSSCNA